MTSGSTFEIPPVIGPHGLLQLSLIRQEDLEVVLSRIDFFPPRLGAGDVAQAFQLFRGFPAGPLLGGAPAGIGLFRHQGRERRLIFVQAGRFGRVLGLVKVSAQIVQFRDRGIDILDVGLEKSP